MKKRIGINGMTCGHCKMHVEEALRSLGASDPVADLAKKEAVADFPGSVTDEAIRAAIDDAGYEVRYIKAD